VWSPFWRWKGRSFFVGPTFVAPLQSSPINCCWPSSAQSFLVSVSVEAHGHNFVISRLLRVLKWGLLFDEKWGLSTTDHSPSTGEWFCLLILTLSLKFTNSSQWGYVWWVSHIYNLSGQRSRYNDWLRTVFPIPVGSRIFSSPRHPDRLCGLHSLLSNRYRGLFPLG
jgi:hypothetical protein